MKKYLVLLVALFILAFGVNTNAAEKELTKDEMFLDIAKLCAKETGKEEYDVFKLKNSDYILVLYDADGDVSSYDYFPIGELSHEEMSEIYNEMLNEYGTK